MKTSKLQSLCCITALASGYAIASTPSVASETILGEWVCLASVDAENGPKIEMSWKAKYISNGRNIDVGTLRFILPRQPEPAVVMYSMATSGTWEIIDGLLAQTTNEVKFENLSHPGLDKIINLADMFPQNVSDSAKILALDDQHLTFQSETSGVVARCKRMAQD